MKKRNKYSKKNIRDGMLVCGTIVIVALGIFAPGRILTIQSESASYEVMAVPEQYYSSYSSAMARNASTHLGVQDKIQLISGEWESETMEAAGYEMELEDYEAVAKAREEMKSLYDAGLYPDSISTDYGDWYSWQAKPRKAVDATFHTYAAYYWEIEFKRYDGQKQHTIYLLEDGTVFLAEEYAQEICDIDEIVELGTVLAGQEKLTAAVQDTQNCTLAEILPYYEGNLAGLQWKSLTQITAGEDIFLVLQAYTENRYLLAIAM